MELGAAEVDARRGRWGRSRGGRRGGGRDGGRREVVCWHCGRPGHVMSACEEYRRSKN